MIWPFKYDDVDESMEIFQCLRAVYLENGEQYKGICHDDKICRIKFQTIRNHLQIYNIKYK